MDIMDYFFKAICLWLPITLLAYGLFPLFLAYNREKSITNRKYQVLCYSINFIVFLLFNIWKRNGAITASPYLLWTYIFSRIGFKALLREGLIKEAEKYKDLKTKADVLLIKCKEHFLKATKIDEQDDGIRLFDEMRQKFLTLNEKEEMSELLHLYKSQISLLDYVLEELDQEVVKRIENGNIDEVICKKGTTYTWVKIYKYVNMCLLKRKRLVQVQYENKLKYIDVLCETKLNKK